MMGSNDSIDALAERCFARRAVTAEMALEAEIASKRDNEEDSNARVGCWVLGLGFGSCVSVVSAGGSGLFTFLGLAGAVWLLLKITRHGSNWRKRSGIVRSASAGIQAYKRGESWAVLLVHEFAVDDFRSRIEAHRQRTLGANSEWGHARASLAEAADEAQRSSAYWRERLRVEPGNKLAQAQGEVAAKLRAKLGEALRGLDKRAEALRRFYNDCDARIAVMDGRNRDLEESRRLEELSGRADMAIAQADEVIRSIASAFVADAHNMAEALGVVATFGAKSLAGDAPLEDIEYFADQIIEDSDRERAMIEDLDRQILHGGA